MVKRNWNVTFFLKTDLYKVIAAFSLALCCFALWPILDPEPQAVLNQFIIKENVGKLAKGEYIRDLFSGDYTVFRIWLGNFANAGLFALPLIFLVGISIKQHATLSSEEKALWILVLSFMVAFTIPAQRQENYLIPTTPALAVLLGTRWPMMKLTWFYVFTLPVVLALATLTGIIFSVSYKVMPSGYHGWQLAVPLVSLALAVVTIYYKRIAPFTFHLLVIMVFISLSCALAPFHGPLGKYSAETLTALKGKTVYIPSNWLSSYERHRFLLPGAEIEGYDMENGDLLQELLRSGQIVAVHRAYGDSIEGPYEIYGSRFGLRSRHTNEEISKILFQNRIDLLIQKEIIIRRLDTG